MPCGVYDRSKMNYTPYNKGKSAGLDFLRAHATDNKDQCLIWPFSKNWNGYGQMNRDEKIVYAHRVMCELVNGPAPSSKQVAAHSCNNGHLSCVSPRHLSWKTPSQNLLDRRKAGTLTKKRWHKKGLLTQEQIAQIVALKGQKNQREIGEMFGISYQHVSVIQNGRLKSQQRAA